ncbi:MAG: lysoplasmalogenase [Leptospiraceae bacterium]|nr:lysoplasmalogenase [Leptospiraceae bacterium]
MNRKLYFIVLFALSILYIVLTAYPPFPGRMFLKAAPIWMLAGHVFLTLKDRKGRLLLAGILLGSAGDIALATDYKLSFVIGLGFFLIGHLFYISSFAYQWMFRPWKLLPAGIVLLLSVGLSVALTPYLGGLTIPVYAYVFVITLMVIFAIFRRPANPAVWIGAVLFLLSDAIIALREFMKMDIPNVSILVMGSYYLAQILIAEGSIEDEARLKS